MDATYYGIAMRQGNSPSKTAICDDVTVTYQWDTAMGTVILCRALRDANKPDGALLFEDDSGFSVSIPSIYAWVEHQPTYQGQFDRNPDASIVNWHACDDIRVEPAYYENGIVKLCRAMCAAGLPDGDMMLTETRPEPLRHYIPSIHHYAKYRLISEAAEAEIAAREKATDARLLAQGEVELTVKPLVAKPLTEELYRIMAALQKDDVQPWRGANYTVRATLLGYGYVTGVITPAITEAGEQAIARYENPYQDMSPDQLVAIAEKCGLHVNGNASQLAETLSAIDAAMAAQSMDDIIKMTTRCGVRINFGRGKKGEELRKRIALVTLVNSGHEIAA